MPLGSNASMAWLNRIKKFQLYQKSGFLLSIKTLKVRTMSVALMNRFFFIATVVLYIYIVIALFIYCVVWLLLYCMSEAWEYCFLYIYILFLFLASTSIFL